MALCFLHYPSLHQLGDNNTPSPFYPHQHPNLPSSSLLFIATTSSTCTSPVMFNMPTFSLSLKHRQRQRQRNHSHFSLSSTSRIRLPSSLTPATTKPVPTLSHHHHRQSYQRNKSFSVDSIKTNTSTVTPLTTPTSSALSSSPSASLPTSDSHSAQSTWPHLSKQAKKLLTTLPNPKDDITFYEEAFFNIINEPQKYYNENPFLWHSFLTTLLKTKGKAYPLLKQTLTDSLVNVPTGYRGILYYFEISNFPSFPQSLSESIEYLSEISESDPYPSLYNQLAKSYIRNKNYDLARSTFQQGVKLFSKNAELWKSWTFFEIKFGSKEIALHTCRETLDRDVSNSKAWVALIKLQIAFGAGDAHLVDVLMEALTACPYDPILRLQLARIEEKRKGGKAALQVLKDVMYINHPDVMRMIGRILFDQGDWNGGRIYLRRAADIDNGNDEYGNKINDRNNKNSSRSSSALSGSLSSSIPDNNEGDIDLVDESIEDSSMTSSLLSKQKRISKKKHNCSRKQKAVKALHAWSLMESKVGNVDEARTLLSEARALSQTDPGIWRAIAELEAREKNYGEARRAYQNALDIDPNDARILLAWSRTETLAGDLKKSEQLMDRVDKLPPNRKKSVAHLLSTSPQLKRTKKGNQQSRPLSSSPQKQQQRPSISQLFDVHNSSAKSLDIVYDDDEQSVVSSEDNEPDSSSKYIRPRSNGDNNAMELTPHVLGAALRERAIMASREGRLTDCVRLLSRASTVDPANETTWRLLASNELRRTGEIKRLRSIYKQSLEHIPSRLKYKILHWWGQDERSNGNLNEARELFHKATMANPDYMSAWMSYGLLEKSNGNIDEACKIFEQAIKRVERDSIRAPYIFQAWGNIELKERNRIDVAAEIFEKGVNLAPSCAGLWTDWGMLEYERGDYRKSRRILQKAIQVDERHIDSWITLAKLECDRCNFKTANNLFEKALNGGNINNSKSSRITQGMGSEHASVLVSLARMEGEILGNVAIARDIYERALEIDEEFGQAWRAWGVMEMRAGNFNRARDLFERASLIHGEEVDGWHLLGVLAWDKYKNAEEAMKMWKKILEKDEAHASTFEQWGRLEIERGNLERGRIQFRKGIEIIRDYMKEKKNVRIDKDGYTRLLIAWGCVELKDNKWKKAEELAKEAINMHKASWEAWELLAEIERWRKPGDKQGKLRVLKEGIENCEGKACGKLYLMAGEIVMEMDGNLIEARKLWKSGIDARPSDYETWRGVARMEKQFGDPETASNVTRIEQKVFSRRLDCENDVIKFITERDSSAPR